MQISNWYTTKFAMGGSDGAKIIFHALAIAFNSLSLLIGF